MKVVANPEDLTMLVSVMLPSFASEIPEVIFRKVNLWLARCQLGIDSTKIELVLFTIKTTNNQFHLPQLNGC